MNRTLIAIAALALLASPVGAGEFTGTRVSHYAASGTASQIAEGQWVWNGVVYGHTLDDKGVATGEISECHGWSGPTGRSVGSCVNHPAGGDMFFVEYDCNEMVAPRPNSMFTCTGTIRATGGTGKYAKIAGSGTIEDVRTGMLPGGTVVGYTIIDADYTY